MDRSYEINPVEGGGWKLQLWENGEEAGGGKCDDDDGYNDLLAAAEEFAGIDSQSVRP